MKIYTKTGDAGDTGLFGGDRVGKHHARIQAIGEIDELNACVGIAVLHAQRIELEEGLIEVQNQLFALGAELATTPSKSKNREFWVQETHIALLEKQIDDWSESLEPLKNFILPGGGVLSAHLHLCRAVCRRAERAIINLNESEPLDSKILRYINRLSDWFFVAARLANHNVGKKDVLWIGRNQ